MEYYSAIKRHAFESVLMRWIIIEPIIGSITYYRTYIIQSEVSQKEKDKYHILMHTCVNDKNVTEEFIYRAEMEKQT